jgi:putative serine protease PepD
MGTGAGRSEALAAVSAQQAAQQAAQRSAHESAQPSVQGGQTAGQHPMGDPMQQIAAHVLPGVVALHLHSGNVTASGSGIVLTPDGLLLTNDHVVAGAAHGGQLTVVLHDGTSRPAHILGRDPATDIAVVAADGVNGLTPAAVGNSDSVRVGEHVVEVGAPLGQGATPGGGLLSTTISGLSHPAVTGHDAASKAPQVLSGFQTDTAVSPASSGGPLVDSRGLVIGIDTVVPGAVAAATAPGVTARSGFAIPINLAERVAKHLIGVARGVDTTAGARTGVGGRPAPLIPPPGAKIVEPRPVAVSKPTP